MSPKLQANNTNNTAETQRFCHTISPVFSPSSQTLILGSFPSVRSRECGFYYAHPQNRFWKVLAFLFDKSLPKTESEKRDLILSCNLALWDVVASCEIKGSADSLIKNPSPNDVASLLSQTQIKRIFTNGKTSHKLYEKLILPKTQIEDICLPSTSPANAAFSFEMLCEKWSVIKK